MVDGPGDDIRAQLAALLGKPLARIGQVRKTDETPPRVSVIDVICAVMGLNGNNAAMTFARLKDEHPDLTTICGQVKFTDCKGRKGNRGTPVIDVTNTNMNADTDTNTNMNTNNFSTQNTVPRLQKRAPRNQTLEPSNRTRTAERRSLNLKPRAGIQHAEPRGQKLAASTQTSEPRTHNPDISTLRPEHGKQNPDISTQNEKS